MEGLGAVYFARREKRWDIEIRIARPRRANADGFVCELDMHRVGVGSRMDRHGRDSKLLSRAQNPQGNFAAIGNENFVEHHSLPAPRAYSITSRGWPYSTG